ncbi:winged helix-turn-helix transcriptional regulator [Candidatus Bathyarchaeota archaeon]|nr:MAG: winged helix-turn-helix transcriptional regulator [Candidatus Bathyarchaeota archaeon]
MKPVKMITDPVAMELLGDDTRRRIIYLLRARELTISQIAEELRMTPQAIYHHIKKLLPVEMVEVTREERVDNFIETYYRATAEVFSFSWGTSGKNQAQAEQRLRDTLLSLDKLGIKVRIEEGTVAQIIKTQGKIETFGGRQDLEERVSKLDGVDFLGKQELASVATMISLTDKQFQEWLELQKELRKLLKGLLPTSTRSSRQKTS